MKGDRAVGRDLCPSHAHQGGRGMGTAGKRTVWAGRFAMAQVVSVLVCREGQQEGESRLGHPWVGGEQPAISLRSPISSRTEPQLGDGSRSQLPPDEGLIWRLYLLIGGKEKSGFPSGKGKGLRHMV